MTPEQEAREEIENHDQGRRLRLAVLATLVKQAPQKPGRTALMKYAYLL